MFGYNYDIVAEGEGSVTRKEAFESEESELYLLSWIVDASIMLTKRVYM
jgi:hypothetical protein